MLEQFTRQNRWWSDPSAIAGDRHLIRMAEASLSWEPPLPFSFDRDAVYTLRGPRQVGKSTILKRQIRELLSTGLPPRRILYLDVELAGLETGRDLVAALRAYLDAERSPAEPAPARCAVFLDEVTRVANWAGALRGLVDNGELSGVTIVATGSHTRDLRSGGERLPGRRGTGGDLDWELLPLSFREYVSLVDPGLRLPSLVKSLSPDGVRAERRLRDGIRPRLVALLERYLATGGFLTALNAEARHGLVLAETYQVYREAIVGEFTRAGMRESYLRELVNWLARHLGQEFDYRDIAADTDIGSKDTARNYFENLEASYIASVCFRSASLEKPTPSFRGPKKAHPVDPLVWHLVRAWAASDPDPWPAVLAALESRDVGHLVESAVAGHLRRASRGRVHYWHPDSRREIDFVVEPSSGDVALVEVKYQRSVDEHDARQLAEAGGGILATRLWEGDLSSGRVCALPVAEFLAILDASSLTPCR